MKTYEELQQLYNEMKERDGRLRKGERDLWLGKLMSLKGVIAEKSKCIETLQSKLSIMTAERDALSARLRNGGKA